MLWPHRPFRTVIEDRKINFSIGKSVFHFAVVKNTLKLADFIGRTKKKKKKKSLYTFLSGWNIEGLRCFAFWILKDAVFFLHAVTELLASMIEVLK